MSETIKKTQQWLLGEPMLSFDSATIRRDSELQQKIEAHRIEGARCPPRLASDNHRRTNNILYGIGKGVHTGLIYSCGNFLELWISPEDVQEGNGLEGSEGKVSERKEKEKEASIAARVNARARKSIRRIVNTNDFRAMYTLTLAPPSADNDKLYTTTPYADQKNYDVVRRMFKIFVQRVRRKLGCQMPYCCVFELHDSDKTCPEKRGCWHIHLAAHVDSRERRAVFNAWNFGRVDVQDFRYDKQGHKRDTQICNPGAYIAEYIGKEGAQFGSQDLRSKKRYTQSRVNLKPLKSHLDAHDISGDFDRLKIDGKIYRNIYYNAKHVPGTKLYSVQAHYVLEVTTK